MSGIHIIASDNQGVYIPRNFMEDAMYEGWKGISEEDKNILLAGPDHEQYWDAWDMVLNNAHFTDGNNNKWLLFQDGDLFIYCEKLMSDEEFKDLFGEERENG